MSGAIGLLFLSSFFSTLLCVIMQSDGILLPVCLAVSPLIVGYSCTNVHSIYTGEKEKGCVFVYMYGGIAIGPQIHFFLLHKWSSLKLIYKRVWTKYVIYIIFVKWNEWQI